MCLEDVHMLSDQCLTPDGRSVPTSLTSGVRQWLSDTIVKNMTLYTLLALIRL